MKITRLSLLAVIFATIPSCSLTPEQRADYHAIGVSAVGAAVRIAVATAEAKSVRPLERQ